MQGILYAERKKQVEELENVWLGVKEQYQINNILNQQIYP